MPRRWPARSSCGSPGPTWPPNPSARNVGAVNVIREPGFLLFLAIALVAAGIASTFILAGREIEAGWMVALTGAALVGARWTAARSSRLLLVGAVAERLSEAAVFGA